MSFWKTWGFLLVLNLLTSLSILEAEPVQWQSLMAHAWDQSPEGVRSRADKEVAQLSFDMAKINWFPDFGVESPNALTWTRSSGTSVPILGRESLTEPQDTLGVAFGFGIRQRLPGEGQFQTQVTHRVERNLTTESYRQTPTFILRVTQPLGPTLFDWRQDPLWLITRSDLNRSSLLFLKAQTEAIRTFLGLIQHWHLSQGEFLYRQTVWKASRLRKELNDRLYEKRTLSESEKWKSDRASITAQSEMNKAKLVVRDRSLDLVRIFGTEPPPVKTEDLEIRLRLVAVNWDTALDVDVALLQEDQTLIL